MRIFRSTILMLGKMNARPAVVTDSPSTSSTQTQRRCSVEAGVLDTERIEAAYVVIPVSLQISSISGQWASERLGHMP